VLKLLYNLDVWRVSLVTKPAVKRAVFLVVKSGDPPSGGVEIQKESGFVAKSELRKQVFGYALEPNTTDTQEETISEEDVEKAAHSFLMNAFCGNPRTLAGAGTDLNHTVLRAPDGTIWGFPIESVFDHAGVCAGENSIKGGWWLGWQLSDPAWEKFLKGEITGVSIWGWGERDEISESGKAAEPRKNDITGSDPSNLNGTSRGLAVVSKREVAPDTSKGEDMAEEKKEGQEQALTPEGFIAKLLAPFKGVVNVDAATIAKAIGDYFGPLKAEVDALKADKEVVAKAAADGAKAASDALAAIRQSLDEIKTELAKKADVSVGEAVKTAETKADAALAGVAKSVQDVANRVTKLESLPAQASAGAAGVAQPKAGAPAPITPIQIPAGVDVRTFFRSIGQTI